MTPADLAARGTEAVPIEFAVVALAQCFVPDYLVSPSAEFAIRPSTNLGAVHRAGLVRSGWAMVAPAAGKTWRDVMDVVQAAALTYRLTTRQDDRPGWPCMGHVWAIEDVLGLERS